MDNVPYANFKPKAGVVPIKPARLDEGQVGGTHYKDLDVTPWEVMEVLLTPEEFRGFLKGNLIKYAIRQGRKADSDDGSKTVHYKAKLKEVEANP